MEIHWNGLHLLKILMQHLIHRKFINDRKILYLTRYTEEPAADCVLGFTQRARGVLWTFPEGSLKVLTSVTYRGPSGYPQGTNKKTDDLMKIFFFRNIALLDIYYCFLQEEQIFKSYKRVRPRDFYKTQLWDVPGTEWWDVIGTSAGRLRDIGQTCFLNSTHKHSKLTLIVYSRLQNEW